jgi:hypothetical protein
MYCESFSSFMNRIFFADKTVIEEVYLHTLLQFVTCMLQQRNHFSLLLRNTKFRKSDMLPSSGEVGDTYCVGSVRKSKPQSMEE